MSNATMNKTQSALKYTEELRICVIANKVCKIGD